MKYAIVDASKAEAMGIDLALHRASGGKVVLNENELLMMGKPSGKSNLQVAKGMGGTTLLTRTEARKKTQRWKK